MRNILIVLVIISVGCAETDRSYNFADIDEPVTCEFMIGTQPLPTGWHDGTQATETCSDESTSECTIASYCGNTDTPYTANNTDCSAGFVRTEVTCDSGNVYSWDTLIPKKIVTCNFIVNDSDITNATETCLDGSSSECTVTSYFVTCSTDNADCSTGFVHTDIACNSGNVYSWNAIVPQKK